jgi:uncharacterized membrane protein YgcG
MKSNRFQSCALLSALLLALTPVVAQQPPPAPATAAANPGAKTFSQQDLDQLLAPIALYPDPLLAQIFMASTYPLEVVQAARWAKENSKLTGKALEDALTYQTWDPAVKSLTAVPQVLQQMNDKLDWTQKLGDAFLAQQSDVMNTVQLLRAKAAEQGNLKTTEQQVVTTQTQGSQTIYVVESPKPEVVYVPTYNPSVVYGPWPYPAPPYYMYPPSYVYPPGLAFATGVIVGAAIWGNCNWGRGDVDVNVNRYNNFNQSNISNKNWNHNVDHRGGVAYKDQRVANQYNRGGNSQASQARDNYRGRAESGRSELSNMDRNQLNDRVQSADRASAGARDRAGNSGAGARDRAGASGGGFSGVGNGASTREASQRGGASRGDMGGRGGAGASSASRGGGSGATRGGGGGGGSRGGGGRGGGGRR